MKCVVLRPSARVESAAQDMSVGQSDEMRASRRDSREGKEKGEWGAGARWAYKTQGEGTLCVSASIDHGVSIDTGSVARQLLRALQPQPRLFTTSYYKRPVPVTRPPNAVTPRTSSLIGSRLPSAVLSRHVRPSFCSSQDRSSLPTHQERQEQGCSRRSLQGLLRRERQEEKQEGER